tara:strand:- start:2362 stop:2571 length:210 start_codon:yes stop_codon:yes gene_type:complete
MKKQETLWKKLHPECKQAIKNIKKDYPTTFENLKNQLKNETSWVNIRYGTASRIMDECDISFFGNAFRK